MARADDEILLPDGRVLPFERDGHRPARATHPTSRRPPVASRVAASRDRRRGRRGGEPVGEMFDLEA